MKLLAPNDMAGTELCHGPTGMHVAHILLLHPCLLGPLTLLMISHTTTPSQKYYRPDLTYGRGGAAKSYSKQRISPFFYVVSIESNIKTSSERQFNSL